VTDKKWGRHTLRGSINRTVWTTISLNHCSRVWSR